MAGVAIGMLAGVVVSLEGGAEGAGCDEVDGGMWRKTTSGASVRVVRAAEAFARGTNAIAVNPMQK